METEDAVEIRAYDGTLLLPKLTAKRGGVQFYSVSADAEEDIAVAAQPDEPVTLSIGTPKGPYLVMGTVSQIERIEALSPEKQLEFVEVLERIRNG